MSSSSPPETTTGKNGGSAETAAAANAGGRRWEVADVVRRYGDEFRALYRPLPEQRRVLWAIENCQTEVLGGHWMHCEGCAREHGAYHSCRNRHCPSCLGSACARWVEAERAQLLPVPYFHVVFTLPHTLNPLLRVNQALLYGLLFQCAAATLQQFAADPDWLGAQLGITAVLHTWGQTMEYHVHLHCVVTGGGLGCDGKRWKLPRKGRKGKGFLFHVLPLGEVFRAKYRDGLERLRREGKLVYLGESAGLADDASWRKWLDEVLAQNWVVYAKRPFAGPDRVLKYLSRYTHRVAISNQRIVDINDETGKVHFTYKDYRGAKESEGVEGDGKKGKEKKPKRRVMKLDVMEFLRRFLQHVRPKGFVRIRHYGIVGNRGRKEKLAQARRALGVATPVDPGENALSLSATDTNEEPQEKPTGRRCPHCGSTHLRIIRAIPRQPRSRSP